VTWVNKQLDTHIIPSHVARLTAYSFNSTALNPDTHTLVKFYAPWCDMCKRLTPHFEKVARVFQFDPVVALGKVDASKVRPPIDQSMHRMACNGKHCGLTLRKKSWRTGTKSATTRRFCIFTGLRTQRRWISPMRMKCWRLSMRCGACHVNATGLLKCEVLWSVCPQKAGLQRGIHGDLNTLAGRVPQLDAVVRGFSSLDADVQKDILAGTLARCCSLGTPYCNRWSCSPDVHARIASLSPEDAQKAEMYTQYLQGV
jgi:hypothetical protein